MKSIKDIDLSPKPGKKYWVNCHREWREEFIYFLLVDRFHDSNKRHSVEFDTRHSGFGDSEQLTKRCGGTIMLKARLCCSYSIQNTKMDEAGVWKYKQCRDPSFRRPG